MYRDTITLFCISNGQWRATKLEGVDLNADRAAIIARLGVDSGDRATLHIKYKKTDSGLEIADGIFAVKPQEYNGADSTVTFASGENFSFFMNGEWNGDALIDDNDSSYPQGFYNYMNEFYAEVYAITSAAIYSVIPHFEVIAK